MLELPAGSELAGYRIESVAGRGGMGIVYRASDIALERMVALKLISDELAGDESFRERFKRESRLAASIRHPNVITVFRAGEEDGRLYIAMDYVEGTDLKSMIAEQGRLEPRLAADIVAQVASALDAAHAKTLVHRDVKPANVLIASERGRYHAYLTDFGLTKSTASLSAMTQTGLFVGTIDYAAPEQVHGGRVDARTDVYSLGCVLYHAVTGRVPYPKESSMAKMYAHAQEPPPSVLEAAPGAPAELEGVVKRAMAKEPEARYLSAGDLGRAALAAVERRDVSSPERSVATGAAAPLAIDARSPTTLATPSLGGVTVTAEAATAPRPLPPAPRRRRLRSLVIAGAAAFVFGIAIALVLVLGGDGGGKRVSRDQYQDQVLDAFRPVSVLIVLTESKVPARVDDPSKQVEAGKELAKIRRGMDEAIARLQRLKPPTDVVDLHSRLLDTVRRMRADVANAVAAADFGDEHGYVAASSKFGADQKRLDPLGPAFKSKGYPRLGHEAG